MFKLIDNFINNHPYLKTAFFTIAAVLVLSFSLMIFSAEFASARNECLCGICTSVVRNGIDECSGLGSSCTIPSCGSATSCSLACGTNMQCQAEPGYCNINAYSMWNYGPTNKCYSFTSSFTGNAVCNMELKTACFGLNNGQQTQEKIRVVINGQTIGESLDTLCNDAAPPICHEDGPVSTAGNNIVVAVNTGLNNIRFESVQDSISIQSFTMNCVPQTQTPVCGDGRVESPEQCEQNSQCNDNNPDTADVCNQCICTHTQVQYCGNGRVDVGEQCEFNNQCNDNNPNTADSCNQCMCSFTQIPFCGNGKIDSGEQCEQNSQCNDNNPQTQDSCVSCQCKFTQTNSCGDGYVGGGEQCEPPLSNNNAGCEQSTNTCLGTKTGIRDLYGYCSGTCGCIEDPYAYACIKNSCGAQCGSNADCNDNNPTTLDTCTANCGCQHQDMPYCGNGKIDAGEQCEQDEQCGAGKICSGCRCTAGAFCGDANVDSGEQCDYGIKVNGIPCVAPTNGTCKYCTSNCTLNTLTGGSCGNYKIEYQEQCDEGANNGALCTPNLCNDFCVYCQNSCQIGYVNGPKCLSNNTVVESGGSGYIPSGGYWPGYGYYGYSGAGYYSGGFNTPSASICGDGTIGVGEECDNGYENGIACSPACNGECTYCSGNCEEIILDGGICKRQARPWDPVVVSNPCKTMIYPVSTAQLDSNCDGNSKVVTREVNASDNLKARQGACKLESNYIYLNWTGVIYKGGLRNISVFLEHFEENADIRVEAFDGLNWVYQCDVIRAARDSLDSCILKSSATSGNVDLRIRITRSGNNAYHNLDLAYLSATYCSSLTSCGNGITDIGESCDDGNKINGDGCDEFCAGEYAQCSDWGMCENGRQEQLCYFGTNLRTISRSCSRTGLFENMLVIWLVFLLILLVLLFLFFPALYLGFARKKK